MDSNEETMEKLRPDNARITLCGGKVFQCERMKIGKQLDAIKFITKFHAEPGSITTENAHEKNFEFMVGLLSIASGLEESIIRETSYAEEIVDSFTVIWKQNRFDFLLDKVRNLSAMQEQESKKASS